MRRAHLRPSGEIRHALLGGHVSLRRAHRLLHRVGEVGVVQRGQLIGGKHRVDGRVLLGAHLVGALHHIAGGLLQWNRQHLLVLAHVNAQRRPHHVRGAQPRDGDDGEHRERGGGGTGGRACRPAGGRASTGKRSRAGGRFPDATTRTRGPARPASAHRGQHGNSSRRSGRDIESIVAREAQHERGKPEQRPRPRARRPLLIPGGPRNVHQRKHEQAEQPVEQSVFERRLRKRAPHGTQAEEQQRRPDNPARDAPNDQLAHHQRERDGAYGILERDDQKQAEVVRPHATSERHQGRVEGIHHDGMVILQRSRGGELVHAAHAVPGKRTGEEGQPIRQPAQRDGRKGNGEGMARQDAADGLAHLVHEVKQRQRTREQDRPHAREGRRAHRSRGEERVDAARFPPPAKRPAYQPGKRNEGGQRCGMGVQTRVTGNQPAKSPRHPTHLHCSTSAKSYLFIILRKGTGRQAGAGAFGKPP